MNINKLYICLLFAVMALMPSCKYDDLQNDVDDLTDRVTLLEEQVKLLNDNMAVISNMFEGKLVINKVEKGKDSFTLTFSDNTTLTLSLGSESSVRLPDMKVVDGMWVIEDVNTNIPVKNEVPGQNGFAPKFKLELDANANKYYYTVSTNGGETYEEVMDENGKRVYVTVDNVLPGDPFFAYAKLSDNGNEFIVGYRNPDAKDDIIDLKLPVMKDLSCEILFEGEKKVNVIAGASFTVKARVVGDGYMVYPPIGWEYEVKELENNEIEIVLTAPASSLGRATADNMSDLTVMVYKGNFWAVDKLVLTVISNGEASPVDKYMSNDGLEINGVVFSAANNGAPLVVDKDVTINNEDAQKYQVFFIEAGKTVTITPHEFAKGKFRGYTGLNLVFMSLDPAKPGTVKVEDNASVQLESTEHAAGHFAFKDIIFDASALTGRYPVVISTRVKPIHLNIDHCTLKMNATALTYLSAVHTYDSFTVTNSDIVYPHAAKINPFINLKEKITEFGKITLNNNIFYCKDKTPNNNYKLLFNVPKSTVTTFDIECTNNTFVGLEPNAEGLFVMQGAKNFIFNNNILWSVSDNKDNVILKYIDKAPAVQTGDAKNNICHNRKWMIAEKETLFPDAITKANPFEGEGAVFDCANGVFKTSNTYKGIGATR